MVDQLAGIAFRGAGHERRAWVVGTALDVWQIVDAYREARLEKWKGDRYSGITALQAKLTDDESRLGLMETNLNELREQLQNLFGLDDFRPRQREVIEDVLRGRRSSGGPGQAVHRRSGCDLELSRGAVRQGEPSDRVRAARER